MGSIPYSLAYDFLENSKNDFDFHSKILKNRVAVNAPIESSIGNLQTPSLIVAKDHG